MACVFVFCSLYLRTRPITNRRYTLSDMQQCVPVLQLGASALFAPLLPFTRQWVNHATHHTNLQRERVRKQDAFSEGRPECDKPLRSKEGTLTLSG